MPVTASSLAQLPQSSSYTSMKRVPSQSSMSSSVSSLSNALMQQPPYPAQAPDHPSLPVVGNMSFNPYNAKQVTSSEVNDTKMSNNEAFLAFL